MRHASPNFASCDNNLLKCGAFFSENAVPIKPFYDDPEDQELKSCIPFLIALRSLENVRSLLRLRNSR